MSPVDSIKQAMEAVNKTHQTSNELRENHTPKTLNQFREQVAELAEHLTHLQTVLDKRETFALGEMADWLSEAFSGTPSE